MPERKIILVPIPERMDNTAMNMLHTKTNEVLTAINDGWELDPKFYNSAGKPQPMRTERAVFYHLVKYAKDEMPRGLRVVKAEKVKWEEVNAKLAEGWVIEKEYSADALMCLYGTEEPKKKK